MVVCGGTGRYRSNERDELADIDCLGLGLLASSYSSVDIRVLFPGGRGKEERRRRKKRDDRAISV